MNQFNKQEKVYVPQWVFMAVQLKVDRNKKVQNKNSNKHLQ